MAVTDELLSQLRSGPDADKERVLEALTLVTIFTTIVGFLAGLLAPSPLQKKNG